MPFGNYYVGKGGFAYKKSGGGGNHRNPKIGLITGIPAGVNNKYVAGSGVGGQSIATRRAKLNHAASCTGPYPCNLEFTRLGLYAQGGSSNYALNWYLLNYVPPIPTSITTPVIPPFVPTNSGLSYIFYKTIGTDLSYTNNTFYYYPPSPNDTTIALFLNPSAYSSIISNIYIGTVNIITGPPFTTFNNTDIDNLLNGNYNFFQIQIQGYFYAPISGTYIFKLYADDILNLYIGDNALQPTNYNVSANYINSTNLIPITYDYDFTANTYTPILFYYGQSFGGCSFNVTLTLPSGNTITDLSGYVFY